MRKIKKLAVVLAATATLALTGCGSHDEFNGWLSGCLAAGGHASPTHLGEWSNRYECFKDDVVIVVPGYEGD